MRFTILFPSTPYSRQPRYISNYMHLNKRVLAEYCPLSNVKHNLLAPIAYCQNKLRVIPGLLQMKCCKVGQH